MKMKSRKYAVIHGQLRLLSENNSAISVSHRKHAKGLLNYLYLKEVNLETKSRKYANIHGRLRLLSIYLSILYISGVCGFVCLSLLTF